LFRQRAVFRAQVAVDAVQFGGNGAHFGLGIARLRVLRGQLLLDISELCCGLGALCCEPFSSSGELLDVVLQNAEPRLAAVALSALTARVFSASRCCSNSSALPICSNSKSVFSICVCWTRSFSSATAMSRS